MAATMIGGTAYVAGKAGAKAGAANAQAAQPAPAAAQPAPAGVQQAPAAAAPPTDPQPVAAAPAEVSADDKMDQLTKLKQLLDMDALTQEEFDAQKARILASM
jgi:hypothetical protein